MPKIRMAAIVSQLTQQVTGQTIVMISDQLISKAKQDAANNLLADKNYQSASPDIQKKLMDAANLAVDQKYGIGSTYWTAATAISGALAGLAGGNGGAALAGGLAPYLSEAVKIATTKEGEVNVPANLAGHALAGALIAYLQGGSLSARAVGGAGGEAAARVISAELYPGIKAADLTNEQKANISALSTLAAGLAGGVLNDSSMAGVQAAAAGKTAVENNALSVPQIESFAEKAKGCEARGDCGQIVKEMEDLSLNQQKEMIAVCSTNPKACKDKYGDIPTNGMLVRKALDSLFDADVPAEMKNDISSFWAQQMEAEGVVTSTEFASQLESRYGMDKQQSEILAMAVLGAVTSGMGKAGASTPGKTISAKPEWLQNVQAGNKFNAEQSKNYPYNELYVNKPNGNGYYRVDSYNPATGEIVSRKFTQFADITEATATNYIREAVNKYPAGATVANVPSSGDLGGSLLKGKNILEIPPQAKPIP
jgi:filamentous hemagglutinin